MSIHEKSRLREIILLAADLASSEQAQQWFHTDVQGAWVRLAAFYLRRSERLGTTRTRVEVNVSVAACLSTAAALIIHKRRCIDIDQLRQPKQLELNVDDNQNI